MLESMYLLLIGISFAILVSGFWVKKFVAKSILFLIAAVLFGALAIASGKVEMIICTSVSCNSNPIIYTENMWIFASFCTISVILFIAKAFDSWNMKKQGQTEDD